MPSFNAEQESLQLSWQVFKEVLSKQTVRNPKTKNIEILLASQQYPWVRNEEQLQCCPLGKQLLWADCLRLLSSLLFSKATKVNTKYRIQVLLGEVIILAQEPIYSLLWTMHSEVPSCGGGGGESQRIWGPGANAEER